MLALLDGYGIRTLIGDGAMPLERARQAVSSALARDLEPARPLGETLQAGEPARKAARAASRPVRTAPSM